LLLILPSPHPAFYLERYLRCKIPLPYSGEWASPPEKNGKGNLVAADRVNLTGGALISARAGYYGLINHIDDQLYRLYDALKGEIRRNT